jgi:hypothetical protein
MEEIEILEPDDKIKFEEDIKNEIYAFGYEDDDALNIRRIILVENERINVVQSARRQYKLEAYNNSKV